MQNDNSRPPKFETSEKLKAALLEKIKLAEEELKDPLAVKGLLQKWGRKTSLARDEKRPYKLLYDAVERRLLKDRLWKQIQDDLAQYGFGMFYRNLQKQVVVEKISDIRKQQLELFPGFEALPTRIRHGSAFVRLHETTVLQFLSYEKAYQERAAKSRLMAAELHELAERVRPFAGTDLRLVEAFERAEKQAKMFLAGPTAPERSA